LEKIEKKEISFLFFLKISGTVLKIAEVRKRGILLKVSKVKKKGLSLKFPKESWC